MSFSFGGSTGGAAGGGAGGFSFGAPKTTTAAAPAFGAPAAAPAAAPAPSAGFSFGAPKTTAGTMMTKEWHKGQVWPFSSCCTADFGLCRSVNVQLSFMPLTDDDAPR